MVHVRLVTCQDCPWAEHSSWWLFILRAWILSWIFMWIFSVDFEGAFRPFKRCTENHREIHCKVHAKIPAKSTHVLRPSPPCTEPKIRKTRKFHFQSPIGCTQRGRTLRKDVFLPSKPLLSAFYKTLPSKNPSKKHLLLENLLRTLLRRVWLHDPLGVRPIQKYHFSPPSWDPI